MKKLVIKITKEDFEIMKHNVAVDNPLCPLSQEEIVTIIANGTPLPEWIPASEKLPETVDDVLACDGRVMFIAWHCGNGKWESGDDYFDSTVSIKAWMPLPEPYTAERSEKNEHTWI